MTRRLGGTLATFLLLAAVTACASAPTPAVSIPSTSPPAASAAPTCETILPAQMVADFASIGWTARSADFVLRGEAVPGGVECTWGDYSRASDHVQVYGWAPIGAAEAQEAIDGLVAEGWTREEASGGAVDVTDAAAGEDGTTYRFGSGWVALADTRQGVLLVAFPRS